MKRNIINIAICFFLCLVIIASMLRIYELSAELEYYRSVNDALFQNQLNQIYALLCEEMPADTASLDTESVIRTQTCCTLIGSTSYADHNTLAKLLTSLRVIAENGKFHVLYSDPAFCEKFGRMLYTGFPIEAERETLDMLLRIETVYLK